MIVKGRACIWGTSEVKPIINIAASALAVKVRMRPGRPVTAYVRYADRVEQWVIVPADDRTHSCPEWKLGILQSTNWAAKKANPLAVLGIDLANAMNEMDAMLVAGDRNF